jgi:hypothetical protein
MTRFARRRLTLLMTLGRGKRRPGHVGMTRLMLTLRIAVLRIVLRLVGH